MHSQLEGKDNSKCVKIVADHVACSGGAASVVRKGAGRKQQLNEIEIEGDENASLLDSDDFDSGLDSVLELRILV